MVILRVVNYFHLKIAENTETFRTVLMLTWLQLSDRTF